jgi:hypothetical protein
MGIRYRVLLIFALVYLFSGARRTDSRSPPSQSAATFWRVKVTQMREEGL